MRLEVLVEEESAEVALRHLIPKILGPIQFSIHVFNGKRDLRNKLLPRLRGFRRWLPKEGRIVVLLDEDRDDCRTLKLELENAALQAGFETKSSSDGATFTVLNRIAVEELEAWFFGDLTALRQAYPRVPITLDKKAAYRDPDRITGGTWERLEKVLQKAGYHKGGLAKIRAARDIAVHMDPARNRSRSCQVFCEGLHALVAGAERTD